MLLTDSSSSRMRLTFYWLLCVASMPVYAVIAHTMVNRQPAKPEQWWAYALQTVPEFLFPSIISGILFFFATLFGVEIKIRQSWRAVQDWFGTTLFLCEVNSIVGILFLLLGSSFKTYTLFETTTGIVLATSFVRVQIKWLRC